MLWQLLYQILNMLKFWLNRENVVDLIGADNGANWSGKSLIYELKTVLNFVLEDRNFVAVESLDLERDYFAFNHALFLCGSELKKDLIIVSKII